MAAAIRHRCPLWAEMQPELVSLVLRRLHSLADRVRFGAVCRAWRRVAGDEAPRLPPPLPWLTLLDGTFLSVSGAGGEIHDMRVPEDASVHGSVGNWLLLRRTGNGGGGNKLQLMNPFSRCVMHLPMEADGIRGDPIVFFKLVQLSTHPDPSPDSLFALAIVTKICICMISIGRQTSPSAAIAAAFELPEYIFDLAFVQGKLYGLSNKRIFTLEIVPSYEQGKPPARVSSMRHVAYIVEDPGPVFLSVADKTYICIYRSYLAESGGKLFQIRRRLGAISNLLGHESIEGGDAHLEDDNLESENHVTISFEVFELDLTTDSHHNKWTRLTTLGDQALFVGTHSKFLSASECGAQNCIYFVYDYDREHWTADPFRDCGVFNMSNGKITPLLPDTTIVRPQGCRGLPTWFFPTKTM